MLSLKQIPKLETELDLFFISVISLDSDVFTLSISYTSKYIFIDKQPENMPSVLNVYKCVIFKLSWNRGQCY